MTGAERLWVYPARTVPYRDRATGVVDGDTLNVRLSFHYDFGFGIVIDTTLTGRMRLLGVNCPETGTPGGAEATLFTEDWIARALSNGLDWPLSIETRRVGLAVVHEVDHFGRYLGVVTRLLDGRDLATDLLANGHAVPMGPHG